MYYFILPYFYLNYKFNSKLLMYTYYHPERTNFPANIKMSYGNFPFSFWNGGLNINKINNHTVLYPEAIQFQIESNYPVIIDCSNSFLQAKYLNDNYINMVLSIFENSNNFIKISDQKIKDNIVKKYPNYKFILSSQFFDNKDIELNQNYINQYNYIELSQYLDKNIINKNKIICPLLNKCYQCNNIQECLKQEHYNQINFSNKSQISNCLYNYDINLLQQEFQQAKLDGYTIFQFQEPVWEQNEDFKKLLVLFFIKPQYHKDFFEVVLHD